MKIVLYCFLVFALFVDAVMADVISTSDVSDLNNVFNKTYNAAEWTYLERLHLDALPEKQFPEAFEKLRVRIVDLLPAEEFNNCREQEFTRGFQSRKDVSQTLSLSPSVICLSGRYFTVEKHLNNGSTVVVNRIKDEYGNKFVLKRWNRHGGTEAAGSLLVLKRARKSASRINMPKLVNLIENYSIEPEMQGGLVEAHSAEYKQFQTLGDCELLLRVDGIYSAQSTKTMRPCSEATPLCLLPKIMNFRQFVKLEVISAMRLEQRERYLNPIDKQRGNPTKCILLTN